MSRQPGVATVRDVRWNRGGLLSLIGCIAVLLVATSCALAEQPATPRSSPASSAGETPSESTDHPAFVLDLETNGQITQVFVFDPEKIVVEARPARDLEATAAIDALSASDIVAFRGGADDVVVIGWLVTPCDRQAGLTVVARTITVELPPRAGCDALAIGRLVALRLADPARAALFEARLIPATILPEVEAQTPVAPPPTAEGR